MQPESCLASGLPGIYMPPRTPSSAWQTRKKQSSGIFTRYSFGALSAFRSCNVAIFLSDPDYATTRPSGIFAPAETCRPDVPDLRILRTAEFYNNC